MAYQVQVDHPFRKGYRRYSRTGHARPIIYWNKFMKRYDVYELTELDKNTPSPATDKRLIEMNNKMDQKLIKMREMKEDQTELETDIEIQQYDLRDMEEAQAYRKRKQNNDIDQMQVRIGRMQTTFMKNAAVVNRFRSELIQHFHDRHWLEQTIYGRQIRNTSLTNAPKPDYRENEPWLFQTYASDSETD